MQGFSVCWSSDFDTHVCSVVFVENSRFFQRRGKGTQLFFAEGERGRSSFLRGKNQAALFWTTDVANAQAHGRMACKSCAGSSCRSARPPSLNRSIGSMAAAVLAANWFLSP